MKSLALIAIEAAESIVIQDPAGMEIELCFEQLEPRSMPESTAGFLE